MARDQDKDKDAKGGVSRRRRKVEEAPKSKEFEEARTRAERFLHDPEATQKLADKADSKVEGKKGGALGKVITETKALIRLVRAYVTGEYRAVSWESMVLIVGVLIYLVSPIDVIPDFLPGGLVDDAAVIAFALGLVRTELVDYMEWEAARDTAETEGAAA
jgi:uncharacterized membrane protein YkvA (DUF1232 family)